MLSPQAYEAAASVVIDLSSQTQTFLMVLPHDLSMWTEEEDRTLTNSFFQ